MISNKLMERVQKKVQKKISLLPHFWRNKNFPEKFKTATFNYILKSAI